MSEERRVRVNSKGVRWATVCVCGCMCVCVCVRGWVGVLVVMCKGERREIFPRIVTDKPPPHIHLSILHTSV